jgi:hypothetical protein
MLTAGTAVVGAVGAIGLGAGLNASTHYAAASKKSPAAPTKTVGHATVPAPAAAATKALAPSQIQVEVLNGTGVAGSAHAAASDLTAAGFRVVGIGNAPDSPVVATSITYATGQAAAVRTLEAATGVSAVSATGSGAVLVLTVGPDWTGSKPAPVVAPQPAPQQNNQNNNQNNGGGNNGPVVSSGGS